MFIGITMSMVGGGAGSINYLEFDGSNDDRVAITDSNEFTFGDNSNDYPFSVAVDAEFDDFGNGNSLVTKWDGSGVKREWTLDTNVTTGKVQWYFYDESLNITQARVSDAGVSAGRHTIVATYDGTGGGSAANGAKIYIDGSEVASTNTTGSNSYVSMENTVTPLHFGISKAASSWTNRLDGKLYQVKIFRKELTSSQAADPLGS